MAGFKGIFKAGSPDRRRETLYTHLNSMGVHAEMASKGAPEETFRGLKEDSLGLVYLKDEIFLWANVVQGTYRSTRPGDQFYFRAPGDPFYYRIWYGFQDPNIRLTDPHIRFWSIRKKSPPLIGRCNEIEWENDIQKLDMGPMQSNEEVRRLLIRAKIDVDVMGFPDGYWIIANREAGKLPTADVWQCYSALARGLREYSRWAFSRGR